MLVTFSTNAYSDITLFGVIALTLLKMMGHSARTTTTIYLSASAEHLRSQMTKHPLNDLV